MSVRTKRLTRASRRNKFKARIALEQLEARNLMAYTPAQMLHAYGFDQVTFAGGVKGDGTGQTIAIVDAFDDPTIKSDLTTFDNKYGLPDWSNGGFSFKQVYAQGFKPQANSGWALEMALDVEWAHAIAPKASIVLVEAADNSSTNLYAADVYAAGLAGVSVVSNSWGGGEYRSETHDDANFLTPSGHQGVTFVFAAGDNGAPANYPSASPNVLSVGGTTLNLSSTGGWLSESGWSSGGGGPSRYETKPAFQNGVVGGTRRGTPDVAYDADPNTGVAVYDTNNGGWLQVGGTSIGAPQWAGLIAIVNQGRSLNGKGSLKGSDLLTRIYQVSSSDFHDITSGFNGYRAGTGYDYVTGRGSPIANKLIPDLVATVASSAVTHVAATGSVPLAPMHTRIVLPVDPVPVNPTPVTPPQPDLARNLQAFFSRTLLQAPPIVTPSVTTAATGPALAGSAHSLGERMGVLFGGGSDRLADDLDGSQPEMLPASNLNQPADTTSPTAPAGDSSTSISPMTPKAVDVIFIPPSLAADPAESGTASPARNEEAAAPGVELQSEMLGFVALVGSLWTMQTAREEEKRPER